MQEMKGKNVNVRGRRGTGKMEMIGVIRIRLTKQSELVAITTVRRCL